MGTLAAGIGHELNNITTAYLGLLDEVREQAATGRPPSPDTLANLEQIGRHYRMHGTHMLGIGRPGLDQPMRLDPCDVTRDTLSMLGTVGKTKRLDVRTDFSVASSFVFADRRRIEQVLVNFVSNASDATAGNADGQRRLTVTVGRGADGFVFCDIEDNGCGIPEQDLDTIFDPYFTTKVPGQGTGLGLSVVKQIVESCRGKVTVRSRVAVGTVFTFALPASPDETGPVD
ncbi:MAG: HAMP domain-containing histidine kinase [Deltaproteobacteria bacterium]|nr:HAMP domain-containing histidine kinase [Deltaproteobacteria bacterium]